MQQALITPAVWITGAGRGIGRATALLLAQHGYRVVLSARSASALQSVAAEIESLHPERAMALALDVADAGAVDSAVEKIWKQWGPLSGLVNNAGYFEAHPLKDCSDQAWQQVLDINLNGTFHCARAVFRKWSETGDRGNIVNIASLGGLRGVEKFPGSGAYVASKAAVIGLTEVWAVEGRASGIRVNCIAPGAVDTEMLRTAAPHLRTETRPEDIAQTIHYLLDPQRSGHISGSTVEIFSNL